MPDANCLATDQRVPPVRGLILTENVRGEAFDIADIKRWLRVNQEVYRAEKVDAFTGRAHCRNVKLLSEYAQSLHMRLSLRVDCTVPPSEYGDLAALGLHDVFLTPSRAGMAGLPQWLDACQSASLPMRCQFQAPFEQNFDEAATAERLSASDVVSVNITLRDPFQALPGCRDAAHSRLTVQKMNEFAAQLSKKGIEANLVSLPFCLASPENLENTENSRQFFCDHQQYVKDAFEFASAVFQRRPLNLARAIIIPLSQGKSLTSVVDQRMLPFLIHNPWLYMCAIVGRRLTRLVRRFKGHPAALPETAEAWECAIQRHKAGERRKAGPVCSQCRFVKICDHFTADVKRVLPGLKPAAQPGEPVVSPLHCSYGQRKYYDSIDLHRVRIPESYVDLAKEAAAIINNQTPTREIDSKDYEIAGQWTHLMPGGNRWYSYSDTEKISTPLLKAEAPFTLSVTLGGGIADLAGFSFGRHCKIVCPMESYSHQLALHVARDGQYVLLRDGQPVRPVQFEGVQYVPSRLAGVLEPRLSLWNIDGSIVTQTVLVWEGEAPEQSRRGQVKYSIFIMTTRYARRLQAALLSIVNQQNFDISKLEVIVGYVPGIDATDDLLDSIRLTYPQLRIVRVPFAEGFAKSKGFVINESMSAASGEWVALLDSDIVLAPEMFSRIEEVADSAQFIASDGRKMLPPDVTAQILLGNIRTWESWKQLLQGPGEFRFREATGVPIGFFQCFRKSCLNKVQYLEMDHFEGADWIFGYSMCKEFGQEHRLSGVPVLHLDHGGSQWYGTAKHR